MSTEQLKALRDATIAYYGAKMSSDLVAICDRAIASLEAAEQPKPLPVPGRDGVPEWARFGIWASGPFGRFYVSDAESSAGICNNSDSYDWFPMPAYDDPSRAGTCVRLKVPSEQPKPCATIPLPESASELPHCSCGYTGWPTPSCSGCGKPLSAEAHQPPAEQAQQPARRVARTVRREGAPAPATFHEADLDDLEQAKQPAPADVPPMPKPGEMWGHERILALHAACVRIAAERDEARRKLAAERAGRPGSINALTITSLRERLAEAEAELAALKGQEPLFWVEDTTEDDEHNPFDRYRIAFDGSQCPTAFAVYAAPVPPPDSVPREQHEAEVAQARRNGLREALALVERDRMGAAVHSTDDAWSALNLAADGIRALAEKGGEVSK